VEQEAIMAQRAKKGPHKRRRRKFCIIAFWQHCDLCGTHTTTYPNRRTALRAVPIIGGDPSLVCINKYGGVHLAVA
jgi:hypothetical protein